MRRIILMLVALATFSIGTGFVSGLRLLDTAFRLYSPSVPPIQLSNSAEVDLMESAGGGYLSVELAADGELTLNSFSIGTIDNTEALTMRLSEIFQTRREARAYADGWQHRPNWTTDKRIQKTVFIKASGSAQYRDVARVLDAVRRAGADPIGLISEGKGCSGFADASN